MKSTHTPCGIKGITTLCQVHASIGHTTVGAANALHEREDGEIQKGAVDAWLAVEV